MASFEAKLTVDGEDQTYTLRACSFSLSQNIRPSGEPGSEVYAGTIHCEWEDDSEEADETLLNWTKNPREYKNGTIKFMSDREEDQTYRELNFENATIVQYTSNYSSGGQGLSSSFTISAQKLKIGGVEYENRRWDTKRA